MEKVKRINEQHIKWYSRRKKEVEKELRQTFPRLLEFMETKKPLNELVVETFGWKPIVWVGDIGEAAKYNDKIFKELTEDMKVTYSYRNIGVYSLPEDPRLPIVKEVLQDLDRRGCLDYSTPVKVVLADRKNYLRGKAVSGEVFVKDRKASEFLITIHTLIPELINRTLRHEFGHVHENLLGKRLKWEKLYQIWMEKVHERDVPGLPATVVEQSPSEGWADVYALCYGYETRYAVGKPPRELCKQLWLP